MFYIIVIHIILSQALSGHKTVSHSATQEHSFMSGSDYKIFFICHNDHHVRLTNYSECSRTLQVWHQPINDHDPTKVHRSLWRQDGSGTRKLPLGSSLHWKGFLNCCKTQKKKKKMTINYGDQSAHAYYDAMPCLHTVYESEPPVVLLVNATEHVVGDLTIGRKLQKNML